MFVLRYIAFFGLVTLSIFHTLVIFGIFNSSFVWSGYIKDNSLIVLLEIIALSISCYLMYLIIYIIKNNQQTIYSKTGLIFGMSIFSLSFIGNLLSTNNIERIYGSIIAILYIFYFLLEIKKFNKSQRLTLLTDDKDMQKAPLYLFGILIYKGKL